MTYAVGTYVNLKHKQSTQKTDIHTTLYDPGTKVVFIKMVQDLFVLNVTNQKLASAAT